MVSETIVGAHHGAGVFARSFEEEFSAGFVGSCGLLEGERAEFQHGGGHGLDYFCASWLFGRVSCCCLLLKVGGTYLCDSETC